MNDGLEACACGSDTCRLYTSVVELRWYAKCVECGRRNGYEETHEKAARSWNADMKAIKARDVEPTSRSVFPGEWFSIHETIYALDGNKNKTSITSIQRPNGVPPTIGHEIAANTARIMAAAKEMHHKLAEGRSLFSNGYTGASQLEHFRSIGSIIDRLEVDVD